MAFDALGEGDGGEALADLRVRLRAMIAFYRSAEFELLADAP